MAKPKILRQLTVEEYTSPTPIVIDLDVTLKKAAELMEEQGLRHLPVVHAGKICGIVSERDVLRGMVREKNLDVKVGKIMTLSPYIVSCETPLEEVALQMSQNKIGSAIVTEGPNELSGIFTTTDALNALVEILRGEVE